MACRGACRAITGREARRPLRCVTVMRVTVTSALNGQKKALGGAVFAVIAGLCGRHGEPNVLAPHRSSG
eukprot:COSAG01_NODE_1552_length_9933_cov_13.631483_14_plen_69_part_00